ncbi:hypothetical protein BCS93_04635 [Vibrio breoganii]|uniref:Uncharacterized protein n=1 Tax=Vibrio breoganii TaxID=553239 RepID=A0AAP8MZX2_9VIBR|nr:hypothetical protein BCS93_04635 [Vibrio breoganii]
MFFWMIVFYCFFIYCAKFHGHLDYTGGNELNNNSNKELFDSMDKSTEYYADPNWSDLPDNIYHKDNR